MGREGERDIQGLERLGEVITRERGEEGEEGGVGVGVGR